MFAMSESPGPERPPQIESIFEAARLGWNVRLTCWKCGHVRVLHAAALWLRLSLRGRPDRLIEVKRYARCVPCLAERNMKIGGPRLDLTRDPPDGEAQPLPSQRQWKEGARGRRG